MPSRSVKSRSVPSARSLAPARRPRPNREPRASSAARVGWLLPGSRPERLLVDFAGSGRAGGLWARTTVRLPAVEWRAAAANRRPVLLLTDADDPARPIIVGLVHDDGQPAEGGPLVHARVDGVDVTLEARQQIELRCGKSSLVLRRDGRIILAGVEVETRAAGTNRVRGGVVKIN